MQEKMWLRSYHSHNGDKDLACTSQWRQLVVGIPHTTIVRITHARLASRYQGLRFGRRYLRRLKGTLVPSMFEPIRGGTRGGQAEFKWSDVSADKDREHYLGHSINAPTGRWQKNKDVHWYGRDKESGEAERDEEIRRIKEAEAEALSIVLGFGPTGANATQPTAGSSSGTGPAASNTEDDARKQEKEERRRRKAERKEEKRARKEGRRSARDDQDNGTHRGDRPRSRSPIRRRHSDEEGRRSRSPTLDREGRRKRLRDYDETEREKERERHRRLWDMSAARNRSRNRDS